MLEKLFGEIFGEAVREVPKPPEKFSIEIPADHPKAAQLMKLASELASYQQLPGGITVSKLYKPGAADKFLDALSELGVNVDEIRARLNAKPDLALNLEALPDVADRLRGVFPQISRP